MLSLCRRSFVKIIFLGLAMTSSNGLATEYGKGIVKAKELILEKKTSERSTIGSKTSEKEWKSFKFKDEGFAIDLPTIPAHSKQTIEIPQSNLTITYDTYVSELNEDAVYVVSVWEYPNQIDMSSPEINLQEGFSGMLSALPESQILLMKAKENQGFKALEFWVKNEEIFFKGELISAGNKLYQLFVVYKDNESKDSVDYPKFISSFKLMKEPSKSKATNWKKVFLKTS
ncbi:MAG: hypothetical protein RR796_04205 [Victivallaceae bacterium]